MSAARQGRQASTRIALVGHEPDLGELAAHSASAHSGRCRSARAASAASTSRASPSRRAGSLIWFLPPKVLRRAQRGPTRAGERRTRRRHHQSDFRHRRPTRRRRVGAPSRRQRLSGGAAASTRRSSSPSAAATPASLAAAVVQRGVSLVVAWGGDGTVNEVASALAFRDRDASPSFRAVPAMVWRASSASRSIRPAAFSVRVGRALSASSTAVSSMAVCSSTSPALASMRASRTSSRRMDSCVAASCATSKSAARELFTYEPDDHTIVADGHGCAQPRAHRGDRQRPSVRQRRASSRRDARIDDGQLDVVVVDASTGVADAAAGADAVHRQHRARCRRVDDAPRRRSRSPRRSPRSITWTASRSSAGRSLRARAHPRGPAGAGARRAVSRAGNAGVLTDPPECCSRDRATAMVESQCLHNVYSHGRVEQGYRSGRSLAHKLTISFTGPHVRNARFAKLSRNAGSPSWTPVRRAGKSGRTGSARSSSACSTTTGIVSSARGWRFAHEGETLKDAGWSESIGSRGPIRPEVRDLRGRESQSRPVRADSPRGRTGSRRPATRRTDSRARPPFQSAARPWPSFARSRPTCTSTERVSTNRS